MLRNYIYPINDLMFFFAKRTLRIFSILILSCVFTVVNAATITDQVESITITSAPSGFTGCPGDTSAILGVLVDTDCGAFFEVEWSSEQDVSLNHLWPTNSLEPSFEIQKDTVIYKLKVIENCTQTADSVEIVIMPEVVAVAGINSGICVNETIQIGTPNVVGVTYSWTPTSGLNNPNISNPTVSFPGNFALPLIKYVLTADNGVGCVAMDSVEISFFQLPQPDFVTDTVCEGTATTFTNLTPNISSINTFNWTFGQGISSSNDTNAVFLYGAPGVYNATLSVETLNGCADSISKDVLVSSIPTILGVTTADPTDCNTMDGRIIITAMVTQTMPPGIEYSIDGGQTWQFSSVFNGLNAGNYDIVVRNGELCTTSGGSVTLDEPSSPVINNVNSTNPSDCNSADGDIDIFASGGIGPLQYSVDGVLFSTSNEFGNLTQGNYPILVRNADGSCLVNGGVMMLVEPFAPFVEEVRVENPTECGIADGFIRIIASGGGSAHEFSIDNGLTWVTTDSFPNLAAGVYETRVRNIDGTCVTTAGAIELSDPPSPVENDKLLTNPSDCGISDGRIDIDATAGVGATQYSIDGGVTWSTSNLFINLSEGVYEVFLRNGDSTCVTSTGTAVLQAPFPPSFEDAEFNNPSDCDTADGNILIIATGGNGSIAYSIDGGITNRTNNFFDGLGPGTYDLVISNFDGTCIVDVQDITLTAPEGPADPSFSSTNPSTCNGNEGSILVSVTPGTGQSLEYSIDGGLTWVSNGFFQNLTAGTYDILVRNGDGTCVTPVGTAELVGPPAVFINDVTTSGLNDCLSNEGEITISASYAGVQPLEYSVDGGMNYSLSPTFTNLPPGIYNIVVRVFDGSCMVTGPELILESPTPPVVTSVLTTDVTNCGLADGAIFIIENDPNPFEVSIDSGMTYFATTFFSELVGGTYFVWVRNVDGSCAGQIGEFIINEPSQPVINNIDITQPSGCDVSDGLISITITGSTNTQASIDDGFTWQGVSQFSVSDGDYLVRVRNADGTCVSAAQEISVRSATNNLEIDVVSVGTDCGQSNGMISLSATGNTGTLEYSLDGGSVWNINGLFTNLDLGIYNIAVRENGMCVTSAGIVSILETNPPIIDSINQTNPSACGINDGLITINASGSTGDFEYSIDNGITWQTGNTFPALSAGLYQPMVRPTVGGCEIAGTTVTLLTTDAPTITSLTSQNGQCGANGSITIEATSISGSVEYSIDNGVTWVDTSNSFQNLPTGNYFTRVRDAVSLCEAFAGGVILSEMAAPEIANVSTTNPDCMVDDGSIIITLTNAMPGITEYTINNGIIWQLDNSFSNLPSGTYEVRARNLVSGVSCESAGVIVELVAPVIPTLSLTTANPSDCGLTDGRITINATGANGVLEFSLDSMVWQLSNMFANLPAGVYSTFVRYVDGSCTVTGPIITLDAPAQPTISMVDFRNPNCNGFGGSIAINATGSGNLEYSIANPPDWFTTSVFSNIAAGNYTIRVRNDDGSCVVIGDVITLSTPLLPVFENVDVVQPVCTDTDGSITITANLGAEPISLIEYSIDGGNNWQTSNVFNNLLPGSYDLALRRSDDTDCIANVGTTQLGGGEAPEIILVQTTNITDCDIENGQIEIFANGRGGQPDTDVEYSIDGVNFSRSAIFSNLPAGNYTPFVRFLDQSCVIEGAIVTLVSPDPPMRNTLTFVDPSCDGNDGSITATTTGSSTIEYSIDGGNTWFPIGNFINLSAGNYSVAYRYTNGTCVVLDTTLTLLSEDAFTLSGLSLTTVTACDDMDGAVTAMATGPSALEYSIDGINFQASNTFTNLAPGRYELTIRNDDGTCSAIASVFDIDVTRTLTFDNAVGFDVTSCDDNDGRIEVTATSTESLEYSIDGINFQPSPIFDNLPEGIYSPVVRIVGFNCTVVGAEVIIEAPAQLAIANVTIEHPLDCGVDGGMIQIQLSPGSGTVEYSIDGGLTFSGTNLFQGLAAGNYDIQVRRLDGSCLTVFDNNPVMIVNPEPPSAMITDMIAPGCGLSDGSLTATGTPNSNPNNLALEYSLDGINYQSDNVFTGLAAGFYSIHVRLANSSCKTQVDVMLSEPSICLTCDVIREDTLQINQVDLVNPLCLPINLMDANNFDLTLDGLGVMDEGGCLEDSSFFYGYVPLVTLGGSDGPFDLVSWEFNGSTFSGTFQTLDELAAGLNMWDPSNNWFNDPAAFAFGGGSSGNTYGDMVVRHVRTNRTVSLQVNSFAIFEGTQITVTGIGWHSFIATDPDTGCSDTLDIEIIGTPNVSEVQEIYLTTPINTNLQFCDWNSFFTNPFDNPMLCGNPNNGTATVSTCTDYSPTTDFVGYDEYCVVSCRTDAGMTICDTAFINIRVLPPNDRFTILMETGVPLDTCINDFLQLGLQSYTVSDCGGSNDVTFSAEAGNEGCLILTPASGFSGNTSICIVHCDNVPNPEGPICDTTIIDIVVSAACTDDIVMQDSIFVDGFNGVSSVCIPIDLLEINNFDLSIDGQPYTGGFSGCDMDSTWSYLFFALPGGGFDGPYNISWEVDGRIETGTVQDINILVDSMNVWDPPGEWEIVSQISSIVGRRNGYPVGTLTATSLNSGLMGSIDPIETTAVNGTVIVINSGSGVRQLTVLDTDTGCTDEVFIVVDDNSITTDTIRLVTSVDVPILNECLPEDELAMMAMRLDICEDPMNGTAILDVPCFDYAPNLGFVGNDTMCLVLCDFSFPNVCDTTIVIIEVTNDVVCNFFNEDVATRTLDTCAAMGEVCLPVNPLDFPNYTLTIDGTPYMGPTSNCDNNAGSTIIITQGNHELIAADGNGCFDTLQLTVICPTIQQDIVTDEILMVGTSTTVCLSDFGLPINDIASVTENCTPNGNADFNFDSITNCLTIDGIAEGQDTTCFEICLTDGTCFNWDVFILVNDGCDNFITPENSVIGVDCSADSIFVCVRGFNDINSAAFNLEIDGVPHTQPLEICGFDSTFSYSYNTLPGGGDAGPYEITSWLINGVEFTGTFNTIPDLVDSFNTWDPTGDWRRVASSVSITGGNPRNTYGTIFVEQVSTGNPATMSPNVLIVATGIGFYMDDIGNHTLSFLRIVDGCRDTIQITTTCIETDTIRETIEIGEFDTRCLSTNELVGDFSEIFNFCSDESGNAVLFDWTPADTCVTYEGLAAGTEQGCFITCDDLGVCDTTIFIITVFDPNDTIPIIANPDTLVTTMDTRMIINALGNDTFNPNTDTMFITVPPVNGTATFLPDGTLEFVPDPGYCSTDSTDFLEYAICDNISCDTAQVLIIVNCVSDTLVINNGFSPNGDGDNEFFVIEGVENFPTNNLKIFNRWGNRVFEEDGYRNTWGGDWEGIDLPDGTYFYLFDTGDGNIISGYLQILR